MSSVQVAQQLPAHVGDGPFLLPTGTGACVTELLCAHCALTQAEHVFPMLIPDTHVTLGAHMRAL